MKPLLCLLLAAFTPWCACSADESVWKLFYASGTDFGQAQQLVRQLLPEETRLIVQELPVRARTREEILLQSEAVDAGVRSLPCLVLNDEKGAYAAIPLGELSPEALRTAGKLASAPDRNSHTQQRRLVSHLFFHTTLARCSRAPVSQRLNSIENLEELSRCDNLPVGQRQFISLRCLYPALVQFYTDSYQEAHTPDTEQLFRRIIDAVEFARDLDPGSQLGRAAFNERERLRAARLEAKRLD